MEAIDQSCLKNVTSFKEVKKIKKKEFLGQVFRNRFRRSKSMDFRSKLIKEMDYNDISAPKY